jgi:NADH dehydrogenase
VTGDTGRAEMKEIVVVGGGFAGLWSALGAARKRAELGLGAEALGIVLIDRNPYHAIRVRNYEEDLSEVTIPFADLLDPVRVERVTGTVTSIDFAGRFVSVATPAGEQQLGYDRLVLAAGSEVNRPTIPGLAEYGFDIDTYAGAMRLGAHLHAIAQRRAAGRATVLIVGAGLTGIELATDLSPRLDRLFGAGRHRVILADRSPRIGSDMGEDARPVIETALVALGVEARVGVQVARIVPEGAVLTSGEIIEATAVVWCAGMRASPLAALLPVERDKSGRVPVDDFMRVRGVDNLFAAGDCAWSLIDGKSPTVMSCQHARPMGRFAGHNAVADLCGVPMLPLRIDWYTTILDLGAWGAVYTAGRERRVVSRGVPAKETKREINCRRIYPPRSGDPGELLAAAAPAVQAPPLLYANREIDVAGAR